MPLASVRDALPICKLCRGRARNLLAQRRRNAIKQLARLPPDPLTLTPHESKPPLSAPQMLPSSHASHRLPLLPSPRLGLQRMLVHSRVCFLYGVPYLQ